MKSSLFFIFVIQQLRHNLVELVLEQIRPELIRSKVPTIIHNTR